MWSHFLSVSKRLFRSPTSSPRSKNWGANVRPIFVPNLSYNYGALITILDWVKSLSYRSPTISASYNGEKKSKTKIVEHVQQHKQRHCLCKGSAPPGTNKSSLSSRNRNYGHLLRPGEEQEITCAFSIILST